MRILYLADIRFPLERANGIQSMETCHALASRGHEVTLVVRPDSRTPARDPFEYYGVPRLEALHIEVAPIAGPPASRRAGYLTVALGRAAGRARHDVIFTRDLGVAALLLRLPRWLRAPVVYEAHGIAADVAAALPALLTGAAQASASKLRRLSGREARVWRRADGYVTITRGLAQQLEQRLGRRERLLVVPDGARVPEPDDEESSFVIGYAGHLYPWKGVDVVIEAVAALPESRGLIVGGHEQEPDLARVRALAARLGCAGRMTFTGLLPPAEVAGHLRRARVVLLPNPSSTISNASTSPLKLFEYMASGRPIVASDLPSIREVLTNEQNALLVDAGHPPAFVAAIRRLAADPALAARLARQALVDVRAYTWERRAERLEGLFLSAASSPAGAPA